VALDPRVTAVRRDIADIALADRLFAPHYARAEPHWCGDAAVMLRAAPPSADTAAVSQLLPGEQFNVLDITGGWAWGYCAADHYVGYVPENALNANDAGCTHIVSAIGAILFARPDIKAPVIRTYPIGSRVSGTVDGAFLAVPSGGHLHLRHLVPTDAVAADPVSVSCTLIGMPYLWGGRGGGGIDCSGLVQHVLGRAGLAAPRDSDQQRAALGVALPDGVPLKRGDLIFFPGHVGLMVDEANLIHANAHAMAVTIDPLSEVVARIAVDHAQPILSRRRLP